MAAKDEIDALLKDVVTENGRPVILSRYGFKVTEVGGKKYVMAATKEEYDALVKQSGANPKTGYCLIDDVARCYPQDGCHGCTLTTSGGQWVCICSS